MTIKQRSRVRFLVGRVSRTRSKTMAAIKRRDTKAELHLRKMLSERGIRYRLHSANLIGRPDFVFPSAKLVVFCDGDFWHGRRWKLRKPKIMKGVRARYWVNKIEGNMKRDRRTTQALRQDGWRVLRFWETDILKNGSKIADRIQTALNEGLE